jgi:hypothetical protein
MPVTARKCKSKLGGNPESVKILMSYIRHLSWVFWTAEGAL